MRDIPENREKPEEVNPFVKAGQSILEIGVDIKHGFEERADKRHDSWYDYANYWTSGLLDIGKGFGEGLESRGEEVLESPSFYSVTNWISIGGLDLVNGAVNPDEALSKEHLMASFGLASLFSIAKAPVTSGGSSAVKAAGKAADAEKKVKPVEGKEKASSRSSVKGAASKLKDDMFKPILIPSVSNLFNWIRKNVPEVGLVREADTGRYHLIVRKGDSSDNRRTNMTNNFKFGSNAKNHLINSEGFNRNGVKGGHNLDSFNNELKAQGFEPSDCIIQKTPHPTVEGVYEIKYQVPKKDIAGNLIIPKEYRVIKDPKTVYNPELISNEKMFNWGKEAMNNGSINGRRVEGTASNGLKFIGWLDESGNVKNFYPIIN